MRGSEFIYDCVHLLYFKFHKINSNCGGLYKDSSDWKKTKKTTINYINEKGNKYFQCDVTVALNHEKIGTYSIRFFNIYNILI